MKIYLASISILTIINEASTSFSAYKNFYETIVKQNGSTTSYLVNLLWNHNIAESSSNQNSRCYNDIDEFKKGVYSGEEWALRMLDSSAHVQSGFLTGNIINYGNYEECININDIKKNIQGKFCTMQIKMHNPEIGHTNQKYSEIFHTMTMSLCAPNNCRSKQIDEIVKRQVNKTILYEFESFDCLTKKETDVKPTRPQLLIIIFFVAISILLLFGTTYDVLIKDSIIYTKIFKGKVFGMPLAFSMILNGQDLLTENENKKSIDCVYGLRFISACGIIIVHRNLKEMQPYTNVFTVDEKLTKWYRMFIINAYLFVDVFFLLGGLLISYTFLKKRNKGLRPLSLLMHRYIRLTPPLAVTIMLTQLIHFMCSGFNCWQYSVISEKENCKKNWFFTLLYVTNFVDVSKKCLPHSWYLTADMQLFIFSFVLLYILAKSENPKYIFYILTFLLMMNISTVFIVSYIFMIPSIPITSSDINFKEAEYIYEPFYTRAGPWLIGFGLGILIYEFNDNPFKMNKISAIIGWITSIICILTSSFGIYPFFQYDFVHDHTMEYVYKAVYRNVWALGFAWIIYACYTGHGGIVNHFLSYHGFQPLSKLSYCLYLIHPIIQTIQMGDQTYPREFSDMSQISAYIGDIFYSILTAFILHLAIEAPSLSLEKLFKSNKDTNHVPRFTNQIPQLHRFNSNQTETESIE